MMKAEKRGLAGCQTKRVDALTWRDAGLRLVASNWNERREREYGPFKLRMHVFTILRSMSCVICLYGRWSRSWHV